MEKNRVDFKSLAKSKQEKNKAMENNSIVLKQKELKNNRS